MHSIIDYEVLSSQVLVQGGALSALLYVIYDTISNGVSC